jgi:hypothetical protein
MQTRKMKYFFEDYFLYPLVYIGLCIAALAVTLCILLWDTLVFVFSFGKKK